MFLGDLIQQEQRACSGNNRGEIPLSCVQMTTSLFFFKTRYALLAVRNVRYLGSLSFSSVILWFIPWNTGAQSCLSRHPFHLQPHNLYEWQHFYDLNYILLFNVFLNGNFHAFMFTGLHWFSLLYTYLRHIWNHLLCFFIENYFILLGVFLNFLVSNNTLNLHHFLVTTALNCCLSSLCSVIYLFKSTPINALQIWGILKANEFLMSGELVLKNINSVSVFNFSPRIFQRKII